MRIHPENAWADDVLHYLDANLAGIVTPIVIGAIVATTGSFFYALAFIGCIALMGALSYIFILGNVERIVID